MALSLVDELIASFERESQKLKRDLESLRRPQHLRPIYYRVVLTTRPFGLALCKTFDEKYLCVVLPESPSGQLGLRAGSEILSINSFAQKSEVIALLNEEYPQQKHHHFIWMYQFPKVQYLQDNTVMPITLYLKFDPLLILSENTERSEASQAVPPKEEQESKGGQESETSCNYWKQIQDDIYRWAVEQTYELWQVLATCNVYSMPAIQSRVIEQNIVSYYHTKANKQLVQQRLAQRESHSESNLKEMHEFIVQDEFYQKIGQIEKGTKIKVYAKAGAYLEIREPMEGWIKFRTDTETFCTKCEEKTQSEQELAVSTDAARPKLVDFKLFITKNYVSSLYESKEDGDGLADDGEYNVVQIIGKMRAQCQTKAIVLYFMGDIDFGHTFETQQSHLRTLINLEQKYASKAVKFILVRVCCVNNNIASTSKMAETLKMDNKELDQFVYARTRMETLKLYGLLNYDTGFFKYGLMLLNEQNEMVIHPKESMDFEKIEACIEKTC